MQPFEPPLFLHTGFTSHKPFYAEFTCSPNVYVGFSQKPKRPQISSFSTLLCVYLFQAGVYKYGNKSAASFSNACHRECCQLQLCIWTMSCAGTKLPLSVYIIDWFTPMKLATHTASNIASSNTDLTYPKWAGIGLHKCLNTAQECCTRNHLLVI